MHYFLDVMKKYAVFEGRARRKEYWMFQLIAFLISIGLIIIDTILGSFNILQMIFSVAILLPSLGVSIRRLHDIGKSGWWLFIALIPLIGGIWLLILHCNEGDNGSNRYGSDPKLSEI